MQHDRLVGSLLLVAVLAATAPASFFSVRWYDAGALAQPAQAAIQPGSASGWYNPAALATPTTSPSGVQLSIGRVWPGVADVDRAVISYARPWGGAWGSALGVAWTGGEYASDAGTKTNFGFNVKFNKRMTNLQGHVNIIIRSGGRVYQIKANAMHSLGVNPNDETKATFLSKANLTDITDPDNPIGIGGNLTLAMTVTDLGEPGSMDSIGITLWDGNTLLYSSNWTGSQTQEQTLDGGNTLVHGPQGK